jgi:hypothetical protein
MKLFFASDHILWTVRFYFYDPQIIFAVAGEGQNQLEYQVTTQFGSKVTSIGRLRTQCNTAGILGQKYNTGVLESSDSAKVEFWKII